MYAEIAPLVRLPRRFRVFDYQVPDGVAVSTGDVVRISLRRRPMLGIVVATKDTTAEPKTSMVEGVVTKSLLTSGDVSRLMTLASTIAQSPSTMFLTALGSSTADEKPPRIFSQTASNISISRERMERVGEVVKLIRDVRSAAVAASRDESFLLCLSERKATNGQLLIVVPRERDAEQLARLPFGKATALMHGKTSEKERARIIAAWRSGRIRTLIGTRQTSLLPPADLATVVVVESGCDDHRSERRNPRFDARNAAVELARQASARLIFLDPMPRPEDIVLAQTFAKNPASRPELVDMTRKEEISGKPLISASLADGIKNALQSQKNVLLFFNRKGVAKRMQCGACGHVPFCGTCGNLPTVRVDDLVCDRCGAEMWWPKTCPACNSPKIGLRGVGGAKIEADLKELFPTARISRVEKGAHGDTHANIVLATEYFFSSVVEPFGKTSYGLVADVLSDIGTQGANFRSAENVARKMHRLRRFADDHKATCVLQTYARDAVQDMLDAETFLTRELDIRRRYNLPPFGTVITTEDADGNIRAIRSSTPLDLPDSTKITVDYAPTSLA